MLRSDLTWSGGGVAEIVALDANTITLRSEKPHPPGSRVEGALADAAGTLRVKVHGSRREADGAFRIDGRPIDLGRELRESLVAKIADADANANAAP